MKWIAWGLLAILAGLMEDLGYASASAGGKIVVFILLVGFVISTVYSEEK